MTVVRHLLRPGASLALRALGAWRARSWPQELERIFAHLGEPVPAAARERFAVTSISALAGAADPAADRLTGWRRELRGAQVDRILAVAARVGVTAYDDGLEPRAELARLAERGER